MKRSQATSLLVGCLVALQLIAVVHSYDISISSSSGMSLGDMANALSSSDKAEHHHSHAQQQNPFFPDAETLEHYAKMAEAEGISLEAFLERIWIPEQVPRGWFNAEDPFKFLLQNNSQVVSYTLSFRPEFPGIVIENYTISVTSSNKLVYDETVNVPELTWVNETWVTPSNGTFYVYNVTFTFLFDEYTGITEMRFTAEPNFDSGNPGNPADPYVQDVSFQAIGFVFYDPYAFDGTNRVVTGAGRGNILNSRFGTNSGHYDFGVFVQYWNETNSNVTLTNFDLVDSVVVQNPAFVIDQPDTCAIDNGVWNGTSMVLDPNCDYGFNDNTGLGSIFFGLQLGFGVDGEFYILFTWPDFNPEAVDFQNFYQAVVNGLEGPLVIEIYPDGWFRTLGGESLFVRMQNIGQRSSDQIRYILNGTVTSFPLVTIINSTSVQPVVQYTTNPGKGSHNWTVTVPISGIPVVATDLTDPPYIFDYAPPPVIFRLIPDRTNRTEGGITVILDGFFPTFDKKFIEDNVLFSARAIPKVNILSWNLTAIFITLPPKDSLGPASQYVFPVTVNIADQLSNAVPFYFDILDVEILVTGAQYIPPPEDVYAFTSGGTVSMFANPTGNIERITFQWTITNIAGTIITIPGVNLSAQSFSFTYEQLDGTNIGDYIFSVTVTNILNSTASDSVILRKLEANQPQIIVTVLESSQNGRTRASPVAPLEINALVQVLNPPTTDFTLNYTWFFAGQVYEFSSADSAPDNTTTAARFGRILTIPQDQIRAAANPYTARLVATLFPNNIFGEDSRDIFIREAQLIAVIRDGSESTFFTSTSPAFAMTAANSRDPDVLPSDGTNQGLTYDWINCTKSLREDETGTESCFSLIQQGQVAFEISQAQFTAQQLSTTEPTFFNFELQVTKPGVNGLRRSPSTLFKLQRDIVQASAPQFAQLSGVNVTYSDTTLVNVEQVNPLEAVIIAPLTTNAQMTWTFAFTSPGAASGIIGAFAQTGPGYYSPTGGAQASPLFLSAGAFISNNIPWNTRFTLEITFGSPTTEQNVNRIFLLTIPQPELITTPMSITSGDQQTIFSASASSSFLGDFSLLGFKFYIQPVNQPGVQPYCLNGCSQDFLVNFQVGTTGTYNVTVSLVDRKGLAVFDTAVIGTINVVFQGSYLEQVNTDLNLCFLEGDHACVEQLSYLLAFNLATDNQVVTRRRLVNVESGHGDFEQTQRQTGVTRTDVVRTALDLVQRSSRNSFPTADLLQNYLEMNQYFSTLGFDVIRESVMLTDLLLIFQNGLARKPTRVGITNFAKQQLVEAYTNLPAIAKSIGEIELGSTRRRLLQNTNVVNKNFANVYSSQSADVTFSYADNQACGFFNRLTITAPGFTPITSVVVSIRCNKPQNQAEDDIVLAGSNTLSICDEVWDSGLRQIGFYLVSTLDYTYESGYQNSSTPSLTLNLPQVFVDETYSTLPPNLPSDCFTLKSELNTSTTSLEVTTFRLAPLNNVAEPTPDAAPYQRVTFGQTTGNVSEVDGKIIQDIILSTSTPSGVFGASFAVIPTASPTPVIGTATPTPTQAPGGGLSAGAIAGIVIGILLFIIIAIIVAWLIATRCFVVAAPPPVAEGFDYVERDIYGRGFVVEQSVFSEGSVTESALT